MKTVASSRNIWSKRQSQICMQLEGKLKYYNLECNMDQHILQVLRQTEPKNSICYTLDHLQLKTRTIHSQMQTHYETVLVYRVIESFNKPHARSVTIYCFQTQ